MLTNTQDLWQQLYQTAFSESAAEQFWLAAYQSRLAERQGVAIEHVHVNWQRALVARRQTEANWRLGRCVQRSRSVPESCYFNRKWSPILFTPNEILLQDGINDVLYAASVTPSGVARTPATILLAGEAKVNSRAKISGFGGRSTLLHAANSLQRSFKLWTYELSGQLTRELCQNAYNFHRNGRWILAYSETPDDLFRGSSVHWTLLDADGEIPPCRLTELCVFGYKEYAADRAPEEQHDVVEVMFEHDAGKIHPKNREKQSENMSRSHTRTLSTNMLNLTGGYGSLNGIVMRA
ncbi:hypothetical protein THASP1DRAFT_30130 [Thamnocephalis sphaerospora]|uniref:Uncharacterized protein n=1 Tax=Thamnocephalis sphaerospora TaxID=78915 RepID=A0A4P9XPW7_9FUNG|nr:hypothetical protein THASP1DRAFT_30130 [Thamnocephalis sphaerospora]|eukprot:RKP08065.1 hypothetical protein THASP1DRAFT_30130 [Thamnocephalis sphaerospora]